MSSTDAIKREKQKIARLENSLAMEKLKRRRADTRRKIELGGLVVKSAMDAYNKAVILGALAHAVQLIEYDKSHIALFESMGDTLFLES